ncbi:MAG: helix-turn-helix transcriptional regulator [Nakamurella sp.]
MARPRRTSPSRVAAAPEIRRIGDELARRRVELRLTQQLLADLAGVSRSTVQAAEYGTGAVKLASIVEIGAVLELRVGLSHAASKARP